ncbi:hypothetical protein EYR40_001357 [Pleurotus pulmonarius]|nr:hypothetical protein EYR38_004596 [Pleurotus pulmonarius]KAF4609004.1 hypothetical protein EYR40_001357 [Pleurotus pulmonarius]
MGQEGIIFYDIPSTLEPQAWSHNTWRVRTSSYALNIKGIPYQTVWIEYPDIEALCKKIGAAPTNKEAPLYTLPVIQDTSTGAVISDGPLIVEYLDKQYPDTLTLFPPGTIALQAGFTAAHGSAISPVRQFVIPKVNSRLNPRSEEYFRRTRERAFGKKMEDITPVGEARVVEWAKYRDGLGKVDSWFKKSTGRFLMGESITFADVSVVSSLTWLKVIFGEDSPEWKDIASWHDGRWAGLVYAFEKYQH